MKNRGITLVSLMVTIVILIIIASISINIGSNMIKKAGLEELKTDMLLIKTKSKEYVENANFKLGPKINEASAEDKSNRIASAKGELKGTEITKETAKAEIEDIDISDDDPEFTFYYDLSTVGENNYLEDMGIKGVALEEGDKYIVEYNISTLNIEVYNKVGFNGKHSLTDIDKIEE